MQPGHLQQCLDFGAEDQDPVPDRVINRPDAHPIPCQHELVRGAVPQGKGEVAVEILDATNSLPPVSLQDHFRIGGGPKPIPGRDQLLLELDVVEDLSVERHPDGLELVGHGLPAARQVDDAQPDVSQAHRPIEVDSPAVRATVPDRREHPLEHTTRRQVPPRCPIESRDSTHAGSVLIIRIGFVNRPRSDGRPRWSPELDPRH